MKYKNIALTAVILIVIFIIVVGFFGFASLSSSFGYSKTGHKDKAIQSNTVERITVIIDAGHGGIDPGAVENGLVEKELNLKVANKLRQFLLLSDVEVVMTRTEDVLLGEGETVRKHKVADLKARLDMLNNTENCVFVSIHMNKFTAPSAHGLQTFYASASEDANLLAAHIQDYAKMLDPTNNRKIKPDGKTIYILENTKKPAVLVECGFLSNPNDSKLLSTDEYQNKIAFAIYCGIMKYIQEI